MVVEGIVFFIVHFFIMTNFRSYVNQKIQDGDENGLILLGIHFVFAVVAVILASSYGFAWYFCTFIAGNGLLFSLGNRPARMSRAADTLAGGFFIVSLVGFITSFF